MDAYRLGFCLLAYITLTESLSAALVQGTILATSGDVTLTTPSGTTMPLFPNSPIPVGSSIKTGSNSWLAIHWMEGADSVLTQDATLAVLALDCSANSTQINRKVAVRLYSGRLYDKMVDRPGASEFRVKTVLGDYLCHECRDRVTVEEGETMDTYQALNNEIAVQEGEVQAIVKSGSPISINRQYQASLSLTDHTVTYQPLDEDTIWNNLKYQKLNILPKTNTNITEVLDLLGIDPVRFRKDEDWNLSGLQNRVPNTVNPAGASVSINGGITASASGVTPATVTASDSSSSSSASSGGVTLGRISPQLSLRSPIVSAVSQMEALSN